MMSSNSIQGEKQRDCSVICNLFLLGVFDHGPERLA